MTTSQAHDRRPRLHAVPTVVPRANPYLPSISHLDVMEVLLPWWRPDPPRFVPPGTADQVNVDVKKHALDALVDRAAAMFASSDWFDDRRREARNLVARTMPGGNSVMVWSLTTCVRPQYPRLTWDEVFNRNQGSLRSLSKIRDRLRREPVGLFKLSREQGDILADWIDEYLRLLDRIGPKLAAKARRDARPHMRRILASASCGVPPQGMRGMPC